jgi:hypothetical protein
MLLRTVVRALLLATISVLSTLVLPVSPTAADDRARPQASLGLQRADFGSPHAGLSVEELGCVQEEAAQLFFRRKFEILAG